MIALLLLPREEGPNPEGLRETLEGHFKASASCAVDRTHSAIHMSVAGEEVAAAVKERPVEQDLLSGPLSEAWYWPEAEEVARAHRSHVAVVVRGAFDPSNAVERALLLTRVAALLAEGLGATGLYWDGSTSLHSPEALLESAREMRPDLLPLRLWVAFRTQTSSEESEERRTGLFTAGLDALGHREIEIRGSARPREEISGWAYDVAHYILKERVVLKHGEAVGKSPTEWCRVYVVPSSVDPHREVYLLDLEAEE
ncbi:MAG: DUF4261 domain-containing protein [Planctomycetota bacterium]